MNSELGGIWYNQHDSVLVLEVSDDGRLRGTFETGVGLSERGEQFPAIGFTSGDLVAVAVHFHGRHSLTCWVGHMVGEGVDQRLETTWQMAVEFPPANKPDERWKGTWTGADVFVRQPHAQRMPDRRQPSHPTLR